MTGSITSARGTLLLTTSIVAATALLGGTSGNAVGQESMDIARLRQEINNLRLNLDLENDRLRREVDQLRLRVRDLEFRDDRSVATVPRAVPPRVTSDAEEISVRRLVIDDDQGRVRGVLAVSEQYGPMLAFLDAFGNVVTMLTAGDGAAALELLAPSGQLQASLTIADPGPLLRLLDPAGTVRVELGLGDDGAALRLYDAQGSRIAPQR